MNIPGYEQLAAVLQAAYDQAAKGKGAERHADNKPFHEQPMQTGSDLLGTDAGLAFQAIKKIREGSTFTEFDRFERELLGAIVYIAGMIIWRRRQLPATVEAPMTYKERIAEANAAFKVALTKAGYCPECGCLPGEDGTHYATCSKLTAPKEFVEQVEATFDGLEIHEPAQDIVMHVNHKPFDWDADDPNPEPPSMSNEEAAQGLQDIIDSEDVRMDNIARNGNDGEHYDDPWYDAPEWANFKAQDENGQWCWYSHRPIDSGSSWMCAAADGDATWGYACKGARNPNWRDTLIERTSG